MGRTAGNVLVERLIDWGVDTIFGIPGDGINGIVEALRQAQGRIRFIHVRHEEVGALAAVGYAKFTGRLAACFGTAGPGAVHLLTGLLDARTEQAPLLAITGMTYHDLIGTDNLQGANADYLFNPFAVFNERIMGPAHVVTMVDRACRAALAQRGPAHLTMPVDFQSMPVADGHPSPANPGIFTSPRYRPPMRIPDQADLEGAARILAGKKKILILAGAGARGAGEELEQVAERLGAPIAKAMLGKDCVPDDSPYVVGGTGHIETLPAHTAFAECDALLIVGSTMPFLEFYPKPGQAVCVQIDDKPERIGLRYPVDAGLAGDAKATLHALLPLLERNADRAFLEQAQRGMQQWWALMEQRGTCTDVPMKPQVPAWNLWPLLDDDAIICGDAGTVTYWENRLIKLRRGQMFSFSGTNCTMTAGLSYAIGAQAAYPGRQVVAFTGDGSMTMQMGDFLTCVQHRLPVKIIVIKNNTLALEKWEQMMYLGNPEYGNDLLGPDFVKFAEACGGRGVRIEDPARCRDQLREALAMDGPVIVECVVDANEPVIEMPIPPRHAENLFAALRRGTPDRDRIAAEVVRDLREEQAVIPGAINERTAQLIGQLDRGDYRHDGQA
jgi:pyruvate dehydrogenase (quinone)